MCTGVLDPGHATVVLHNHNIIVAEQISKQFNDATPRFTVTNHPAATNYRIVHTSIGAPEADLK